MRGLNELRKELKEVERRRFFNMRIDRWTDENRMIDYECSVKIGKLEEKISRLEKICQNDIEDALVMRMNVPLDEMYEAYGVEA